jgi:uncharacterized Zn finger protein
MAFCLNCGKQNADTVRFCTSCGKPIASAVAAPEVQTAAPSNSKVGNVRKCPACGAEIGSFQARCPECGHELNTVKVASSLQAFVKKLERARSYAEQVEMIESYPIPNSKEDIFEFGILAVTKIKPDGNAKTNSAWATKLKQVYLKAQLAFSDDKETLDKLKTLLDEGQGMATKATEPPRAKSGGFSLFKKK